MLYAMVVFATKVLVKLVLSILMVCPILVYYFAGIFSLSKQKTDETPDNITQKQSHY